MLAAAAKAAGIELRFAYCPGTGKPVDISPRRTDTWENWDPLQDDGDAFRLAVKLQLRVIPPEDEFGLDRASVRVPGMRDLVDAFDKDPYVATRRAIVRAAAAMAQGEQP
jgi:hypothetical protein